MAHDLERLKDEASLLAPGERLELVEHLLGGMDDFADHAAKEWRDEAKDRLNAFRSGELDTVSLADVVGRAGGS